MIRSHLPSQTRKQHLLDHPLPDALSLSRNPLPVLREQALVHGRHRHESVAETLALVGIMMRHSVVTGREVVTVTGAWFQHGGGSAPDNIQAAHCLPGQLVFNSQPLHRIPDWNPENLEKMGLKSLPLASKLRGLFGRTDAVDRVVNEADSLLEIMSAGRGLKGDFARSASQLTDSCRQRGVDRLDDLPEFVRSAFCFYRLGEAQACEERLDELTFLLDRTTDQKAGEKLKHKALVVEEYLNLAQSGAFEPESVTFRGFKAVAEEVVRNISGK